jgi:hypothetical protein
MLSRDGPVDKVRTGPDHILIFTLSHAGLLSAASDIVFIVSEANQKLPLFIRFFPLSSRQKCAAYSK